MAKPNDIQIKNIQRKKITEVSLTRTILLNEKIGNSWKKEWKSNLQ